jgi:hypothetical protein
MIIASAAPTFWVLVFVAGLVVVFLAITGGGSDNEEHGFPRVDVRMRRETWALERSAEGMAEFREHTPGPWVDGRAKCTRCGRGARIDHSPPPNGAEITEAAVSVNCPGARGKRAV